MSRRTLGSIARRNVPRLGTEQVTTSGETIDFTGIPGWAKKINIMFDGVSTSGTSRKIIQIGDSGGIETSGYLGTGVTIVNADNPTTVLTTDGFAIQGSGSAAHVLHGVVSLYLEDSVNFTWVASGIITLSDSAASAPVSGVKPLSAKLDRIRVTTQGGSETFDAGAINIMYE